MELIKRATSMIQLRGKAEGKAEGKKKQESKGKRREGEEMK